MRQLANEDAERSWLNALSNAAGVNPRDAVAMLDASKLVAEDFSSAAHADLFRTCADFLSRDVPLELIALEAALAPSSAVKAAGGRKWLADTLLMPETFGDGAELASIIRDASLRRTVLARLRDVELLTKIPGSDMSVVLAKGSEAWGELLKQSPHLGTAEQDIFRLGEQLDAAQRGVRTLVVPTGIAPLDAEVGGMQPGVLTLIGALPGVGKSSLLATILRNVANRGDRIGMFSLEDERGWVARRLLALESGVPVFVLATRPLTQFQRDSVEEAAARVYETLKNVVIDDRPALSPAEVAQTAREMILRHGCKAILVDHLGEMRFPRSDRFDLDVSEALSVLRDVAKRHNVPVLVASHIRRRQGAGIENEPSLTDFANSSAPERMARVALGLSKPREGCLRVSVLKQTNGKSGQCVDLALIESAAMVENERTTDGGERI